MKIVQKRIAEAAGVSRATVSRYFSSGANVNWETAQRIEQAMQALGMAEDGARLPQAASLGRMVLVTVGNISSEFFANTIKGICTRLHQNGYQVVLCNSGYDTAIEMQYIRQALKDRYAGIIIITAVETPEFVQLLHTADIPVVLVNRYIRSIDLDVISIDNYRGGYIAASYLIGKGHRRILHLSGPDNSSACQDRLRGFADAMEDAGLGLGAEDIVYGTLDQNSGRSCVEEMQRRAFAHTALFSSNDYMAVGAVHAALELGLRVPDDLSVVCFDDSHFVNKYGLKLTTVSYDPQPMGETAADVLFKRIENPEGEKIKMIFSPRLKERTSVRARDAEIN